MSTSTTHRTTASPTGDTQLGRPDLGRRTWWVPLRGGEIALPVRSLVVAGIIAALGFAVAVLALGTGDYPISPDRVVAALVGLGDEGDVLVVREWRLPRTLTALLLGAGLGVGGAIFQSLTRNPLGSPDIIGFGTGSYTGALIVMLVFQGGYLAVAGGSLIGGIATAVVVYALSLRRGQSGHSSDGFRLIITGIGVAAMLSAVNSWLILKAELEDAMRVAIWGAGSLNGITWEQAIPAAGIVAAILVATALLARSLQLMEMGDDMAAALGVRVERRRLLLMAVGITAVALVSATTGPIAFVALAAPQIARRVVNATGVPLVASALTGAVLLLGSDLIAQRIHPDTPLPVGVVTVSLGGGYLVWLLIREGRKAWQR